MQYFCLITSDQDTSSAYESLKVRLKNSEWTLYKNTMNKEKVEENDQLIFYTAGKYKMAQYFVAKATVGKTEKIKDDNEKILQMNLELKNIELFENPVLIDLVKNQLEFIKHKNNLGLNLQGGCKVLTEKDYKLILASAKK